MLVFLKCFFFLSFFLIQHAFLQIQCICFSVEIEDLILKASALMDKTIFLFTLPDSAQLHRASIKTYRTFLLFPPHASYLKDLIAVVEDFGREEQTV